MGTEEALLQISQENDGISWCHVGAHGCTNWALMPEQLLLPLEISSHYLEAKSARSTVYIYAEIIFLKNLQVILWQKELL